MLDLLPTELIFHILSFLIPPASHLPLKAGNPATRTLLSLTLVCKKTHDIANYLIIRNCLYLKYGKEIQALTDGPLHRYCEDGHDTPQTQALLDINFGRGLPRDWFEPWNHDKYRVHTIAFESFFSVMGHCLTRLVLNSDFHRFASERKPPDWKATRVREAFKRLTALEEFVCIQNDWNMCCSKEYPDKIPVWSYWPKLRRLGLAHVDVRLKGFLEGLDTLPRLTHLVLVIPKFLGVRYSQPPCLAPKTIQKLVIVLQEDGRWTLPEDIIDNNYSFLERMKNFRMVDSKENPGRIEMFRLTHAITRWWSYSTTETWFQTKSHRGGLWDLKPTEQIIKDFEV